VIGGALIVHVGSSVARYFRRQIRGGKPIKKEEDSNDGNLRPKGLKKKPHVPFKLSFSSITITPLRLQRYTGYDFLFILNSNE
jgi:hypothetical protein